MLPSPFTWKDIQWNHRPCVSVTDQRPRIDEPPKMGDALPSTGVTGISHILWNMYGDFIEGESTFRSDVQCHFLTQDQELYPSKEPQDATAIITLRYISLHDHFSKYQNASRRPHC